MVYLTKELHYVAQAVRAGSRRRIPRSIPGELMLCGKQNDIGADSSLEFLQLFSANHQLVY
jgi:hypothetical protein